MKKVLPAAALAVAALSAQAGVDVGVSIEFGQPGVYGRVDIGRYPQPVVIAPRPVIIGRPVVVAPQPVYLYVPRGHRLNWSRHCRRYGACGAPVYFVDHRWYGSHVLPVRADRRDGGRDRRYDWHEPDRRDDGPHGDGRGGERRADGRVRDRHDDDRAHGERGRGPGRGDDRGWNRGDDDRRGGRG